MEPTRITLLERLRKADAHAAWEDFYGIYGRPVLAFAMKCGLAEHDARDVLQETMLVLVRKMPEFRYDPAIGKFRNYLFTIVQKKCLAARRRAMRRGEVSLETPSSEDAQPLMERLLDEGSPNPSSALQMEWRTNLREEALRRLREDPTTQEQTFAVFRAYAIEGKPVGEVAARFKLTANNVYQIKNRMIRRLKEEIALLEGDPAEVARP